MSWKEYVSALYFMAGNTSISDENTTEMKDIYMFYNMSSQNLHRLCV